MRNNQNKLYKIDLLSFIAATGVVLYHYAYIGFTANNLSDVLFNFIKNASKYGYLGFDLFLIISGLVILVFFHQTYVKRPISLIINRLQPTYWVSFTTPVIVILLFGSDFFSVNITQYFVNLIMLNDFL